MNEVFMTAAAFVVKRPPTNSMDPGRYSSDMAALQGITAELYENLPDGFHDELENSITFRNLVSKFCNIIRLPTTCPIALQFLKQLNANRRSIIHQFRSSTASEIFGHLTQYYRIQYQRGDLPAFQALMRFSTDDDDDKYPKFPPLLFPDKQHRDMKKLFRSVELTKVRFK
jgi:hypothetical protein